MPIDTFSKKWLVQPYNRLIQSLDGLGNIAHLWPILIFIVLIIADYYLSSQLNIQATPFWQGSDGGTIRMTITFMVAMVFAFEGLQIFYNQETCPDLLKKLFRIMALLISISTVISIVASVLLLRFGRQDTPASTIANTGIFIGLGFLATLFLGNTEWRLVWMTIKSFFCSIAYGILILLLFIVFIIEWILRAILKSLAGIFTSSPKVEKLDSHLKEIFKKIEIVKIDIAEIQIKKNTLIAQYERIFRESTADIDNRFYEIKEKENNRVKLEIDALGQEIHEVENDRRTNRFRMGVEYSVNRYFKWDY